MADIISRKNIKLLGLGLLIISTLACGISVKTPTKQPVKITATQPQEEEQVIFPTKGQATFTPTDTIEVIDTETPTDLPPKATNTKKAPTKTVRPSPTRTAPPPTATRVEILQATLIEQPTLESYTGGGDMTVTAATGNLFVRRGPGTTYNIIAGFSKGVTTKAVGRNEKNDWLAIEIPLAKGAIGWISMGLGYAQLNGSIQSLPLYPFEAPKAAYLRNCTEHDMTTRPGQWNLPGKTTQKVNPGEYQILDMVTGQNKVQDVDLKEGNTVSIKIDGNGASYGCP